MGIIMDTQDNIIISAILSFTISLIFGIGQFYTKYKSANYIFLVFATIYMFSIIKLFINVNKIYNQVFPTKDINTISPEYTRRTLLVYKVSIFYNANSINFFRSNRWYNNNYFSIFALVLKPFKIY